MYSYSHGQFLPCFHCHPHAYIRMVPSSLSLACTQFVILFTITLGTNIYIVFNLHLQVQHLIERCLLLHMSPDECAKALAHHANIRPLITLTGPNSLSCTLCISKFQITLSPSNLNALFLQCGESSKKKTLNSSAHISMLFLPNHYWVWPSIPLISYNTTLSKYLIQKYEYVLYMRIVS